jgi:hypothetical protein
MKGLYGRGPTSAGCPYAKVLFRRAYCQVRLGLISRRYRAWMDNSLMRDFLIVILFVAMVLTPAVVAARSGRDLHSGE